MTDLEITRLCAEAMGYEDKSVGVSVGGIMVKHHHHFIYDPLTDDAQAMALVKRFKLTPVWSEDGELVSCRYPWEAGEHASGYHASILRAICECVANMQAAKGTA